MSDVVFTFVDDQVVDAIVEHLKDLVPLAEGRVYAISTAETLDGWDGRSCPFLIVASGDTEIRLVDGADETAEENSTEIHVSIHDRETEGDNLHRRLGEMVVQVVHGVHSLPFEAVERIERRSVTGVLDVVDEGGGTRSARTVTFSATYYTEPGVADVFLIP